jgi:DnaA family protein
LQSILRRRGWQFDERIINHLLTEGPHRIGSMMEVLNYIQPMFSNLGRSNISKAVISDALRTIDEQTLAAELADIAQETQVDNEVANQDQHTMPLDF